MPLRRIGQQGRTPNEPPFYAAPVNCSSSTPTKSANGQSGRPAAFPTKAGLETHTAAEECYNAAALAAHPVGEVLRSEQPRLSFSRRVPVGTVGVIAPFNFPIILSIRAVAPALALGNSVILKPDPRTAICGGVVLARIFEEAGLPAGVFGMLPGGADAGEAIVVHPSVRVIAFTGSTRAGRAVGELAGRHLKRAHPRTRGKQRTDRHGRPSISKRLHL